MNISLELFNRSNAVERRRVQAEVLRRGSASGTESWEEALGS